MYENVQGFLQYVRFSKNLISNKFSENKWKIDYVLKNLESWLLLNNLALSDYR